MSANMGLCRAIINYAGFFMFAWIRCGLFSIHTRFVQLIRRLKCVCVCACVCEFSRHPSSLFLRLYCNYITPAECVCGFVNLKVRLQWAPCQCRAYLA